MSISQHFSRFMNLCGRLPFARVMKNLMLLFFAGSVVSCSTATKEYNAQEIVDAAIATHGSFKNKEVSFSFRDRNYTVIRDSNGYTYLRNWEDDSLGSVMDILVNGRQFIRLINKENVQVEREWADKYSESINSVLYFFQTPFVLNDLGAIKQFAGEFTIKEEPYLAVKVTFKQDGGGKDFEDVFMYWIHAEKKTVDFLAYSFLTDGGGVRFREAINRRDVKGLLIQDYVNHKGAKGTSLEKLPALFEAGQLENLSLIINDNVKVIELK